MVLERERDPHQDQEFKNELLVAEIRDRARGLNQFKLFELRDSELENENDRDLITQSWTTYVETLVAFGCERKLEVDEMFILLGKEDMKQKNVPGGTFVHTADLLKRMLEMKDYILEKAMQNDIKPQEVVYATALHDTGKLMIPPEILNDPIPSDPKEAGGKSTHRDIFREKVLPRLKEMPADHPIVQRLRKMGIDAQTMTETDMEQVPIREYRYLVPLATLFEFQDKTLPENLGGLLDNRENADSVSLMDIIDRHQESSDNIIRTLPWQDKRQTDRIATMAGSHHQHLVRKDTKFAVALTLKLKAHEPLQSMAGVIGIIDADVAITRNTRPYQRGKAPKTTAEVNRILEFMVKDGIFDETTMQEYLEQKERLIQTA